MAFLFANYLNARDWVVGQPISVLSLNGGGIAVRPPTHQELVARRVAQQEYERQRAKQQAEYEAAEARAASLLLAYLSPEQVKQYQEKQYFDLIGSLGGQYRIRPGYAYNIERRRDGEEVATLCGGPRGVPKSDVMLAQYLALVADEAGFIATANSTLPESMCTCYACRYDDD